MSFENILWLQEHQLNKGDGSYFVPTVYDSPRLHEISSNEGHQIPFVVRTGPISKPDPGLLKRYEAVEINGDGQAYVMVWIKHRLVAWGRLFAQEGPRRPRRLNIPRGLGNGYDIDLYIAMQGRLTGYEVFYEVLEGGEA